MTKLKDDIERLIAACTKRHSGRGPDALARAMLESLWEAGYHVTRRPDMIPIRRNVGEDAPPSQYTAEQEREAQGLTPAELFQRLVDEPRNAAIREKIGDIAGKFGSRHPGAAEAKKS